MTSPCIFRRVRKSEALRIMTLCPPVRFATAQRTLPRTRLVGGSGTRSPDEGASAPQSGIPGLRFAPSGLQHQRGLALITAMLVVAIAATTAAYLSLDQQIWLRQAQNLSDRAQAEVVRAGALEWAIKIGRASCRERV